jgi:ubiquinone/menaquinone biosynthesis C-methylase UbiE
LASDSATGSGWYACSTNMFCACSTVAGCGGAKFTKYVADQRPDVGIVGIDLSEPQLTRASKLLLHGYGDRVRFELGDATHLKIPDASVDGVLSYGSIKHWTSQDAGLAECLRVLKPGGPLLVTDADRSATWTICATSRAGSISWTRTSVASRSFRC